MQHNAQRKRARERLRILSEDDDPSSTARNKFLQSRLLHAGVGMKKRVASMPSASSLYNSSMLAGIPFHEFPVVSLPLSTTGVTPLDSTSPTSVMQDTPEGGDKVDIDELLCLLGSDAILSGPSVANTSGSATATAINNYNNYGHQQRSYPTVDRVAPQSFSVPIISGSRGAEFDASKLQLELSLPLLSPSYEPNRTRTVTTNHACPTLHIVTAPPVKISIAPPPPPLAVAPPAPPAPAMQRQHQQQKAADRQARSSQWPVTPFATGGFFSDQQQLLAGDKQHMQQQESLAAMTSPTSSAFHYSGMQTSSLTDKLPSTAADLVRMPSSWLWQQL